jgi:hypothetical protein
VATVVAARLQSKLEFSETDSEGSTFEGRRSLDAHTILGRDAKSGRLTTKFVNKVLSKILREDHVRSIDFWAPVLSRCGRKNRCTVARTN